MNGHARASAVVRYRRALLDVWDTADDYARSYGAEWYGAANREARSLGDRYGFTTEQAAGVIAALSPRVRWQENLADAGVVLSWCEDARDGFTDGEIPAESLRGDCSAFTTNILTFKPLSGLPAAAAPYERATAAFTAPHVVGRARHLPAAAGA